MRVELGELGRGAVFGEFEVPVGGGEGREGTGYGAPFSYGEAVGKSGGLAIQLELVFGEVMIWVMFF